MRMRNTIEKLLPGNDGVIAVIAALAFATLAGMAALSLDLGRVWNLDTELQNAADAAALSCASQLDQRAGARTRGRLAATGALVENVQIFANDGAGDTVAIQDPDIVFYTDMVTRTVATTDDDAWFCEVNVDPRRVDFGFGALLGGITSASPDTSAVAGLSTAMCGTPPLLICNPEAPLAFDATGHIADGIMLKENTGGGLAPGNFAFLSVAAGTPSVARLRDAWARVSPMEQCFGETVNTNPGQATAVRQGINMRFDVYFQGVHQVPPGEPAVRNNPQYRPAMNNVKGLVRASTTQCSYSHPQGWNKPTQPFTGANPPAPDSLGFPRDDCAYNGGICDVNTGGTNMGNGIWNIQTYLDVNHPGTVPADIPDLYPTDTLISRYEVYRWELDNVANLATGEPEPDPVCHNFPSPATPDRRVITAAVVDCSTFVGFATVKPDNWVEIFLTEPMGVHDGNNDFYGEVVGPGSPGTGGVVHHILQLIE